MTVFFIKSLDSSLVLDHRDDYFAVSRDGSLFGNNKVAIEYARLDHTLSPDLQGKKSFVARGVTRIGNAALDLLKREYRRTGGNGTDDRDIGNNIVFPAQNADSALLERIALDIARLFERIKVRLHG